MNQRRLLLWVLLVTMFLSLLPSAARAAGLTITGIVRNASGAIVGGASVSDGTQTVLSDATTGRYTIVQSLPGTYYVTATKVNHEPQTISVNTFTNLSDVDFSLRFLMSSSVSPSTLTSLPTVVTIEALSAAPSSTIVEATFSGNVVVTLAFQDVTNGFNRWTATRTVEANSADGYHQVTLIGRNASGTVLTNTSATSYSIAVSPVITRIAPLADANVQVVSSGQPMVFRATDSSGLDSTSIVVTLRDLTANLPEVVLPATLSTDIIRSASAQLTAGHLYRTTVTVEDVGGLGSTLSTDFAAVDLEVPTGLAAGAPKSIIATTDADDVETVSTSRTFTFNNLPVRISSYFATLTGPTKHPGFGYVRQTIDLTQAVIHLYEQGPNGEVEAAGSPISAPTSWGTRVAFAQVVNSDTGTALQKLPIMDLRLIVPQLSVTVATSVTRAAVEMSAPLAAGTSPTCVDPTSSCGQTNYPTPDPFPFRMTLQEASELQDGWRRVKDEAAALHNGPVPCPPVGSVNPCAFPSISDYAPGLLFFSLANPAGGKWEKPGPLATANDQAWAQIYWASDQYPGVLPNTYEAVCRTLFGTSDCAPDPNPTHPVSTIDDSDSQCGMSCNHDIWCLDRNNHPASKPCHQYIMVWVTEEDPYIDYHNGSSDYCVRSPNSYLCDSAIYHIFAGGMLATYGFNDASKDQFLIATDTNGHPEHPVTMGIASTDGLPVAIRDYVETYEDSSRDCYTTLGAYVVKPGLTELEGRAGGDSPPNGWGDWSGIKHTNLKQYTKIYDVAADHDNYSPCAGLHLGPRVPDRLWRTWARVAMYSDNYSGSRIAAVQSVFGHMKGNYSWSFGCGPSISYPVPAGCGWTPTHDETQVWQLGVHTYFEW